MNTSSFSLILLLCFFLIFSKSSSSSSSSVPVCKPSSCGQYTPIIRFPFYLNNKTQQQNNNDNNCGYPGFELSCNNKNETIISLQPHSSSGDFVVTQINYTSQSIFLSDPDYCLPQKILNFNVQSTPFITQPGKNFTFFNCTTSTSGDHIQLPDQAIELDCLANRNYSFVGSGFDLRDEDLPGSCKKINIGNVSVQLEGVSWNLYDFPRTVWSSDIKLIWEDPKCEVCEGHGLNCGFDGDTGLGIGCSRPNSIRSSEFSKTATYAIAFGIGIPLLALLIGIPYYLHIKNRNSGQQNSSYAGTPSATETTTRLDSQTIYSYPRTVFGESRRILLTSDETSCSICLCEYKPHETLRYIPDCNHYFHVGCIDEWLKLNDTCPFCRNTLPRTVPPSLPTSCVRSFPLLPFL